MVKEFIKYLLHIKPRVNVQYQCHTEKHGGSYGGWVICPKYLDKDSIIYSFGIGNDISFDISLIQKFNCLVHGFDPTPKSVDWIKKQDLPRNYIFHPVGLSDTDGYQKFKFPSKPEHVSFSISDDNQQDGPGIKCPVKRISTIISDLDHDHIDVLKLDIEGAEFSVLEDMLESRVFPKQILVEFHCNRDKYLINKTEEILNDKLYKFGYRVFYTSSSCKEISILRL